MYNWESQKAQCGTQCYYHLFTKGDAGREGSGNLLKITELPNGRPGVTPGGLAPESRLTSCMDMAAPCPYFCHGGYTKAKDE